ncbi:MAG: hypothetical protein ABS76_35710 [Pelagibacterium sp. SCN 64-44]|nr:MAG: hypothetical protein ABS76_35710 [Pelagibacterium sp. SCN 64-44]
MSRAPSLRRADAVLNSHLQHAWRRARIERLDPHLSIEREERVFTLICGCDPTPQGKYLAWLSAWRRRWWADHGLRNCCDIFEMDRLASGLRHFHEIHLHLPIEMRDINRFATVEELLCAETRLSLLGARSLRKAEREQAYAESELLFDEDHWKLVRLRSRAAARWWGMGTRWCTSARFNNQFELYAGRGPLLVLVTPSDRYQLAVESGEFRNSADTQANIEMVLAGAPGRLRHLVADSFLAKSPKAGQIGLESSIDHLGPTSDA